MALGHPVCLPATCALEPGFCPSEAASDIWGGAWGQAPGSWGGGSGEEGIILEGTPDLVLASPASAFVRLPGGFPAAGAVGTVVTSTTAGTLTVLTPRQAHFQTLLLHSLT